jgi:hypothetical protein
MSFLHGFEGFAATAALMISNRKLTMLHRNVGRLTDWTFDRMVEHGRAAGLAVLRFRFLLLVRLAEAPGGSALVATGQAAGKPLAGPRDLVDLHVRAAAFLAIDLIGERVHRLNLGS